MNDGPVPHIIEPDPVLSAEDEAALDAELAATETVTAELAQLFEVPADLGRRTTVEVTDGLLARSSLSAAVDLVALGWRTVRFLTSSPDPRPVDPQQEATP